MSYIDNDPMPNERVIYKGFLHWWALVKPIAITAFFYQMLIHATDQVLKTIMTTGFIWGAISLTISTIVFKTSEFGITNKRVIIKASFIRRTTIETLNQKVESLGIDQSIVGRMFNFGTLSIKGTGGSESKFPALAYPMAFRKQFYQHADAEKIESKIA